LIVAMDVWDVLDERQRLAWVFAPFESVGPLAFGMTHEQAEAAVDDILQANLLAGTPGNEVRADFWLKQPSHAKFSGPAVTAYYDQSIGLAGIAVNALRGPHVVLDGVGLVGQVPSRLEERFIDYLERNNKKLRYSPYADPCSAQIGLVLRAQRAGDFVLSRPVMVAAAWADHCWDATEGCIPLEEWKTFEW
jgi:hypothetical protein